MGRLYYGDAPLYYGDERLFYGEPYHSPANLSVTLDDAVFAGTASSKIRASMSAVLDDVQPLSDVGVAVRAELDFSDRYLYYGDAPLYYGDAPLVYGEPLPWAPLEDAVLTATVSISKGFTYEMPVCMTITDLSTRMTITVLECELCE